MAQQYIQITQKFLDQISKMTKTGLSPHINAHIAHIV